MRYSLVGIAPHLLPEVSVQLACGCGGVTLVEHMPWLYPLYKNPPELKQGRLFPPPGPGLGLELDEAAVARFKVG